MRRWGNLEWHNANKMQDVMRAELLRLSKKKQVDRVYGDRREPMAAADRKGVCQRGIDPLTSFIILYTQRVYITQ